MPAHDHLTPQGEHRLDRCANCGHMRAQHVYCNETYPSLCVVGDTDESACPCLEFSDDSVPIYGELTFVAPSSQSRTGGRR